MEKLSVTNEIISLVVKIHTNRSCRSRIWNRHCYDCGTYYL